MATISENIINLRSIKSDIKQAITDKGGNVGNDFKTYAQAITNLPSGGGNEDLINLIERDITSLTIPDGTTKIGGHAFEECSNLTDVIIGNGVTIIDYYAFTKCSKLSSVTIPNSVTSINGNAFYFCSSLTDVIIGNGVTSIGTYVFAYCKKLTSITIPNRITNIGNSSFNNCSSLTSVTIKATTPPTLGSNVFGNTNNCPIYVPAESVDAYKAATNWSAYADRIQAIPTV